MRGADSIRAELIDLSRVIDAYQAASPGEWSADWMAMQSLLQRQMDLFQELRLVEGTSEYEITLVGGAEGRHLIDSGFLGGFLRTLQATVGAAVQSVVHGEGRRGRLSAPVLAASRLQVAAAVAGSFVLRLDGPDRAAPLTIEGETELPPFDEAMGRVLDVLQAAQDAEHDEDVLLSAIASLASHRAAQGMSELTGELARSSTRATIVDRSRFRREPREVRLPILASARVHRVLSRTTQSTETVFETGRLTGVRWSRAVFDLEITRPAGDTIRQPVVEVLSGRVITDIRDTVRDSFDQLVRAELQRTVVRSPGDERERVSYVLVGIERS